MDVSAGGGYLQHEIIICCFYNMCSIESNMEKSLRIVMRYESFRFILRMERYSCYLFSYYRINLRMSPKMSFIEIEAINNWVPPNQNWWIIGYTDTVHRLLILNTHYLCYLILEYLQVEDLKRRSILSQKCLPSISCYIYLLKI